MKGSSAEGRGARRATAARANEGKAGGARPRSLLRGVFVGLLLLSPTWGGAPEDQTHVSEALRAEAIKIGPERVRDALQGIIEPGRNVPEGVWDLNVGPSYCDIGDHRAYGACPRIDGLGAGALGPERLHLVPE